MQNVYKTQLLRRHRQRKREREREKEKGRGKGRVEKSERKTALKLMDSGFWLMKVE